MSQALREGWTTGTCAAAAAAASARLLVSGVVEKRVTVMLPNGERARLPVESVKRISPKAAEATVLKDAGDDPDVTDGARVIVRVECRRKGDIAFEAGAGVGVVSKPGLQIPPGEPAINPVPRRMIGEAIRVHLADPVCVTVGIEGGEALAAHTFNPRLGITGGLSVLGTSGRVRPFSHEALRDALACTIDVALASGDRYPVLVPGRYGFRAAHQRLGIAEEQVIEVGNDWGFALRRLVERSLGGILIVGHPGKLAKLPAGYGDTHSQRSPSAMPYVKDLAASCGWRIGEVGETVEAILEALSPEPRRQVMNCLAAQILAAARARCPAVRGVGLISMQGRFVGEVGDWAPWIA